MYYKFRIILIYIYLCKIKIHKIKFCLERLFLPSIRVPSQVFYSMQSKLVNTAIRLHKISNYVIIEHLVDFRQNY